MKLKYAFVFLFCYFWTLTFCQEGFSKSYNFSEETYFNNILLDGDEIVVTGAVSNGAHAIALIAKLDTFGNVLNYNTHEEAGFDLVMSLANYPLIKSEDGGYLMSGDMLGCQCDFIAKWTADLELDFFLEIPHLNNIITSFPMKLLEVEDGYIFVSTKQVLNGSYDIFATKLDGAGNILWEYSYGDPNQDPNEGEWGSAVLLINENEIVIGGTKPGGNFVGLPQYSCPRSWIFAIDSLGIQQWEWIGDDCDGGLPLRIQKTEDNGWLYTTKQLKAFIDMPLVGDIASAPYVVKRDANFNKLWERRLANNYLNTQHGFFLDLKQTNDGHYLMVGDIGLPEPIDPDNTPSNAKEYTCLYKVTTDGDSLFRQCYRIDLENLSLDHRAGGFVELPSGSIIVAGRFNEHLIATYGWLYKVDKNGCMFSGDCLTTDVEVIHIGANNPITISPNPTKDILYIESEAIPDEIILLNMSGHELARSNHRSEIDIRDFPAGVYLLKVRVGEGVYLEKVVKQ